MIEAGELDDLVRRVDPDRWLSSRFITDRTARADVVALYAFDHELARAGRVASNPLIAEIRLVWWREVLDEIYERRPVRAHPTARALSDVVSRRDLPREPLDEMVEGRIAALDGEVECVERAGAGVAVAAASILAQPRGHEAFRSIAELGSIWSRLTLARGGEAEPDLNARLDRARGSSHRIPARLFPAVLHLSLAPPELAGRRASGVEARLRLVWASLTGRL